MDLTIDEIKEVGKGLALRRLKSALLVELRNIRPTLSWSTLNLAFDEPDQDTDLLNWIRLKGKDMLAERMQHESNDESGKLSGNPTPLYAA